MRGSVRTLTLSFAAAMAAGFAVSGGPAQAKFKVLYSFCPPGRHHSCNSGSNPQSGLVMDADGNLFGTTAQGGQNYGTAFELERKSGGGFKFKTIYRFCSFCGQRPNGPLIVDTQGNLYGVADNLVFELSPVVGQKRWSEKILYRFCSQPNCMDGNKPNGRLTYEGAATGALYDGRSPLYGVTAEGGANDAGGVYQLTSDSATWTEAVLYSFCSQGGSDCLDGAYPFGGLLSQAGQLFGTTAGGGSPVQGLQGGGVAFELDDSGGSWSETVLYRFCSLSNCQDGAIPRGDLITDSAGALLGTTALGGSCEADRKLGCGTIFRLVPAASEEAVLYSFCARKNCKDGNEPEAGLAIDATGNLYGTTFLGGSSSNAGTVFELTPTELKTLYVFCVEANCADGELPQASLLLDQSGTLYGTATQGGEFAQQSFGGVIFRINP